MFRKTNHSSGRTRLGRPTPAMAVACAALFMSLGGVGYAAATIGSSQIKNGSVQGKDIKNKTIKTADISKGTRDALKGQTGAQGPGGANGQNGAPGQQGLQGLTGPRGPSNLRVAKGDNILVPQCLGGEGALSGCTALLSRQLAPGMWLIQAKFTLDNDDGAPSSTANFCAIESNVGAVQVDRARTATLNTTGLPGEIESVSLSGVLTTGVSPTVSLRCNEQAGEELDVNDATITALQVETITGP